MILSRIVRTIGQVPMGCIYFTVKDWVSHDQATTLPHKEGKSLSPNAQALDSH